MQNHGVLSASTRHVIVLSFLLHYRWILIFYVKFFQAFCFRADKELLRAPRVVRVGLIQNSIALPTTTHFQEQKRAIFQKLKPIIEVAGASGVNILCLQVRNGIWVK